MMLSGETRGGSPALMGALAGLFPPHGSWIGTVVHPCECVSAFTEMHRELDEGECVSGLWGGEKPSQRGLLLLRCRWEAIPRGGWG